IRVLPRPGSPTKPQPFYCPCRPHAIYLASERKGVRSKAESLHVEVSDMRSQISAAAVAILFSLSICLVSVRSADDSKDLKAKVDKLIKQLDDNDSSKRTQAETELIKLGLDILPLLPEKDEGLSAEQKRRLASVRATLKTADAQKNIQP